MLKNILKVCVAAGITVIGVAALMKSNLLPNLKEKLKNFDNDMAKKKALDGGCE